MSVAVVTDSTACLPARFVDSLTIVPLTVNLGERHGYEGVDITTSDIYDTLVARDHVVTTAQPSPAAFADVYQRLLAEGFTGVLSIHLTAKLSGTVSSATLAAAEFANHVVVVDSGSVAMGLGFPAMAAVRAAEAGGDLGVVRDEALASMQRTTTFFCVDTLEYLRRGGRIGAAASLIGGVLSVKPILRVTSEGVTVSDRVRTTSRALSRLVDLAVEAAQLSTRTPGEETVAAIVHHFGVPQRAEMVAGELTRRLGDRLRFISTTEVGAVIGAHAGPGLVGVVITR